MGIPAPKFRFKMRGARELEQALVQLKAVTARRKVREALLEASVPVSEEMSRRALRLTGQTAMSITAEAERGVGARGVTVLVGPTKEHTFKARFSEFGTSRQPPRPRLRPAWEATKHQAFLIFADRLRASLRRVARRARKVR